ncbi:MAG: hypothetical protein OHK93_001238 [Ramalina farinacea]|uniref:Uncharacterized protein n=1 Tax=Ramalina farinacea TaxID=258253 RepID=A0AA43QR63_9LECA|nr:hypothetical protein [Ramalina farinacea]
MGRTPEDKLSYKYGSVGATASNPWVTSPLRRLPWTGLGALLGALCTTIVSICILTESDGQPIDRWNVQPTVYLAIASTATNILTLYALHEAIRIAWWRRATQRNTTITDLHRWWSYGDSLWAALRSGKHVNPIAIASLLVAIGPINGPLLQRASYQGTAQTSKSTALDLRVAQQLPGSYTGLITGRSHTPSFLTGNFSSIVLAENNQVPISVPSTSCLGKCSTTVPGAGFSLNCTSGETPYDISNNTDYSEHTVFETTFSWNGFTSDPGQINLGLAFRDTPTCKGTLKIRNCTMFSSNVEYAVELDGRSSHLQLAPGTNMTDDIVHSRINFTEAGYGGTKYGGLAKYLKDAYNSDVSVSWNGAVGLAFQSQGTTANRYANTSDASNFDCKQPIFTDPTDDLIQAVRSLMFRTANYATNASETSDNQHVISQDTGSHPVYKTNYTYLWLACLVTALGWLATMPIFVKWWHVGRHVTMSPIEIARAFQAPMLQSSDPNARVRDLLKEVGLRSVRYGAVAKSGPPGSEDLGMHDPDDVLVPRAGQTFGFKDVKEEVIENGPVGRDSKPSVRYA